MREDEFRDRLRAALGEPPALRVPELRRSPSPRTFGGPMAVVAGLLAIVLIVVLMGSRILLRPQRSVGPIAPAASAIATPTASPLAADSIPCALPVNVTVENGGSVTTQVGFVNVPGGGFRVDPRATVADLPHALGPISYSMALRRWLPAPTWYVSPDGTRYLYIEVGAKAASLHLVDATTRSDRMLWTYAAGITVEEWDTDGILVMTVPFAGGIARMWRVDPATGGVALAPGAQNPDELPFSVQAAGGNFSPMGSDGHGSTVFRLGSRDVGTRYSVVVVKSGRVVATLYSGVNGDAKHFDPETASFDAHGIWLSAFSAKRLWLWTTAAGLRSFPVSGLPSIPAGAATASVAFAPAGACVPGTFGGVAASPVVAPSPSPSAAMPAIDWSPLLGRPLTLRRLAPGEACPASPIQHIDTEIDTPKQGSGPDYGYGQWPVYVSGQTEWFSGSQGVIILTSPDYRGPIVVRTQRLDGNGQAAFTSVGVDLGGGATGIPQTGSPPYWGSAWGTVAFSAPGCYGIQFDGNSWTSVAVIQVEKGPPPPG